MDASLRLALGFVALAASITACGEIDQRRRGPCGAGTGPIWLQLTAGSSVDIASVTSVLRYIDR